ncbi:helix-turn-helix domain-containing protein [Bradyrhizobium sp. 187]|jgi:CRP/FNR family nitrogen fixation transcriptional regulator|uniref:helix-turn-helix domain-containing protein n=1 Tax=Bradyrhizobium sp. 187 TaxID=2782655 RepID=UPI001FFEE9DB|nr:helix-turn-helix domain-containing protein [Bradyrhizobium sp. 187]UPJ71277.1 helix-turn-helix domain-containing protein [Bradyrhizobium sp. 187]
MKPIIHPADYYRRIFAAQPHALKPLDGSVAIVKLNRDQQVPEDDGPAGHWYYVIAGAVRRSTIRTDGRRQILDLMLVQDFFFVGSSQREEPIEAVTEETVLAGYSGVRLENLGERDRQVARELREITFQSLERTRQQLVVLGGVTTADKVSAFLLLLEKRYGDQRGDIRLPITRYDLAEYLAVSVETVCRAFSDLQQRRIIALTGIRTVRIVDRDALEHQIGRKYPNAGSDTIAA